MSGFVIPGFLAMVVLAILNSDGAAPILLQAAFYALVLAWLCWGAVAARLSRVSTALWFLGSAYLFWIACHSDLWLREYDTRYHLQLIEAIARNGRHPPFNECWSCYHPPLYFWLAAMVTKVFAFLPLGQAHRELQLLSAVCSSVGLIFALRIAEDALANRRSVILAFLLIMAFPINALSVGRLGNDAPMNLFWMAALFCALRWEYGRGRGYFLAAGGLAALACLSKGSGLVAVAMLAGTVLIRMARGNGARETLREAMPGLMLAAAGVAFFLWWSRAFIDQGIAGNSYRMPTWALTVPTFRGSVFLDVQSFLRDWPRSEGDRVGNFLFWNYWGKTLLVGMWPWTYPQAGALEAMRALSASLLLLVGTLAVTLVVTPVRRTFQVSALLWSVLLAPLFCLGFWWQGKFFGNADARYVHAIVIPLAVLYVRGMETFRSGGLAYRFAFGVAIAVIVSGAAFQYIAFL